jgi:hypothetical protein
MQAKMVTSIVAVLTCGVVFLANAAEQAVSVQNELLKVSFDGGKVSITDRKSGKTFAVGTLEGVAGTARVETVNDATFGKGEAIEIADPNGGGRVLTFPGLPFVLIKRSVTNTGNEVSVLNKIPVAAIAVDLGKPVGSLKGFGTGGITSLADNKGSYMWQAIVDPQSRNGVVGGWITTERGSGVVFAGMKDNQAQMTARVEYGRLRLDPGKTEELETFAVGYFDDARLGMEAWADAVAKVLDIKLPPLPTVYCTWYHAHSSDENKLQVQAEFAAKNLAPFGFSVVQIDDGWQDGQTKNGPRKNFTQIKPGGAYKSGMKAMADRIKSLGLVPGIWLMPFSGSKEDPWYADKQDLFAKGEDGKPHESAWGGTALDMTNPKALAYLRDGIHRIVKEWGYTYLKLDGLASGAAVHHCYVNDVYKEDKFGDAVLFNPEKTNIEGYRDGLRIIRDTAGKETFILGCCTPQNMRSYGGPFGLVDAMRIGPDNSASWGGILRGPIYGARNYHLHGRIWYNDPDPLFVRKKLPLEQSRAICSWVTISGQLSASSDAFVDLPPERLDLLRRTMPSHGLLPRPVDLFEVNVPSIWLLTDTRTTVRRDVVGLFNWDNKKELVVDRSMKNIGLDGEQEYIAYEYWSNKVIGPFKGNLTQTLAPANCAILSLKPVADHPQVISTSRHITQGIVDVVEERWEAGSKVLSGISRVVAGDDYELRVVTKTAQDAFRATKTEVSSADRDAGVTVALKEEDGLARVTIKSPVSREVKWEIGFKGNH